MNVLYTTIRPLIFVRIVSALVRPCTVSDRVGSGRRQEVSGAPDGLQRTCFVTNEQTLLGSHDGRPNGSGSSTVHVSIQARHDHCMHSYFDAQSE